MYTISDFRTHHRIFDPIHLFVDPISSIQKLFASLFVCWYSLITSHSCLLAIMCKDRTYISNNDTIIFYNSNIVCPSRVPWIFFFLLHCVCVPTRTRAHTHILHTHACTRARVRSQQHTMRARSESFPNTVPRQREHRVWPTPFQGLQAVFRDPLVQWTIQPNDSDSGILSMCVCTRVCALCV